MKIRAEKMMTIGTLCIALLNSREVADGATNYTFRLESRGFSAGHWPHNCGCAQFWRNDTNFYHQPGCCVSCGRGFNVAVFNTNTGCLFGPVRNFDTWNSCYTASDEMTAYLESLPDGALIMAAVADAAYICGDLLQVLQALGSTQITNRQFRDSWGLIAVKGEGLARVEGLSTNGPVDLAVTLVTTTGHCGPSAPTSFTATVLGCANVSLTWQSPTNGGSLGVRNYCLYRNGTILSRSATSPWYDTVDLASATNYCWYSLVAVGYDDLVSAPATACVQVGPQVWITLTTTNTVLVHWASCWAEYTLQESSDLSWTNWVSAPAFSDDGTNRLIVVEPPGGSQFYRLFKQ